MNKRESRKNFNIMARKGEEGYNIVRYVNGFSQEPVILFRNIVGRDEVARRLDKALKLIASISSNYGVLVQPTDKSQMVEIAMVIEDSGIAVNDIRVQKDGLVYFLSKGESDTSVRANVEDVLTESNIPFNKNTVTVTRPDLMPKDVISDDKYKGTPTNPEALDYTKEDTVYLQTNPDNIDSSITAEIKPDSKRELYLDMVRNPQNYSTPSDKFLFSVLEKKYGDKTIKEQEVVVEEKKSLNDYLSDMINSNTKFDSFESFVEYFCEKGFNVEEIASIDESLVVQVLK